MERECDDLWFELCGSPEVEAFPGLIHTNKFTAMDQDGFKLKKPMNSWSRMRFILHQIDSHD